MFVVSKEVEKKYIDTSKVFSVKLVSISTCLYHGDTYRSYRLLIVCCRQCNIRYFEFELTYCSVFQGLPYTWYLKRTDFTWAMSSCTSSVAIASCKQPSYASNSAHLAFISKALPIRKQISPGSIANFFACDDYHLILVRVCLVYSSWCSLFIMFITSASHCVFVVFEERTGCVVSVI